ncbi:MAG: hypothetical protein A2284_17130 [Deltaproteobacteria bacterium RIFOXYA12_FULL_61_11]|nr:MAG: hypothetical protein A2284_17130 [Deltaproteobacteria bacterium RIFOXYA12_FULL_61_11]
MFKLSCAFLALVALMSLGGCQVAEDPYDQLLLKSSEEQPQPPDLLLNLTTEEVHLNLLGLPIYNKISLVVELEAGEPLGRSEWVLSQGGEVVAQGLFDLPRGTQRLILYQFRSPGFKRMHLLVTTPYGETETTADLFLGKHLMTSQRLDGEGAASFAAREDLPLIELDKTMRVAADLVLTPARYVVSDPRLAAAFEITAPGVSLDCKGSIIYGPGNGIGILNKGHDAVLVRNCTVENFRYALSFSDSSGHFIGNNDFSGNYLRPSTGDVYDFLEVKKCPPPQEDGGGGIEFTHVRASSVLGNTAKRQQNGLLLQYSDGNLVEGNDFSDNHGWGMFLCHASENELTRNVADNMYNRSSAYCHEVQQDGCDAAAITIMKGSNHNRITHNSIRNSGDGIFLAGLPEHGPGGADHNYFYGNDASFTKHLGFEATFSEGNVFEHNKVVGAGRAGFWLGYSKDSAILDNYIAQNGWEGVNIDHGEGITIEGNQILDNQREAIKIWRSDFLNDQYPPPTGYTITSNVIVAKRGLSFQDTVDSKVSGNCIELRYGQPITQQGTCELLLEANASGPCARLAEDDFVLDLP